MDQSTETGPEIRPLRKGMSRLVVTVALVSAGVLAIYASFTIVSMRSDPTIRSQVEEFEQLKARARADDRAVDSTGIAVPIPDSTGSDSSGTNRPKGGETRPPTR